MADATTRILHNTTDKPVLIREIPAEIRAHDHVSVTTKYHQPVNLENYPGVVDVTDMTPEEQRAFYEQEQPNIDQHAAPRAEAQRKRDDALNVAEAEAKGLQPGDKGYPEPLPRPGDVVAPTQPAENQTQQGAQNNG